MSPGEFFLTLFLDFLCNQLASLDLTNFGRREELSSKLKKLEEAFRQIKAVLSDAEEKQTTESAVTLWLEELRDLVYDMDDLVDELSTEALGRKLTANTIRAIMPARLNPRTDSKIEKIRERVQETVRQINSLGLQVHAGGGSSNARETLPTTCLRDEPCVYYGRDEEKRAILSRLLNDEASTENEMCVIPIVGMPGVSKTTLAQWAFNDDAVNQHFDMKVWIRVSCTGFNVTRVTKTILQSITPEFVDDDIKALQVSLEKKLAGKKFLMVLDDVWNEDYDKWTLFRIPLRAGAAGSKVIVTARSKNFVPRIGGQISSARTLQELSDDDCQEILTRRALGKRSFDEHPPDLRAIGEKIVAKCKGLPLAAKALGGLLRTRSNPEEWAKILQSEIWDSPEKTLPAALRLSYQHLPSHLKRSFAYCSLFPKGYEFDMDELVLLWMAEGSLAEPNNNQQMEDLGREYFGELLSRSLLQPSSGNVSKFTMHDLINDLARSVAAKIFFSLEDQPRDDTMSHAISEKVRHSSFTRHMYDTFEKFKPFSEAKNLRTFLALPIHASDINSGCYLSTRVLHELLMEMKCLRVLSLSGYRISELPMSLGDLKHLRYLNFSYTAIRLLPESVCKLYNLQTLILRGCKSLSKLPVGMGNLINLRHLDLIDTDELEEMPFQVGKLRSLQTFSKFIISGGCGLRMQDLGNLSELQGKLSILKLQNMVNMKDSLGFDTVDAQYEAFAERLVPPENLKRLSIERYKGLEFPSWLRDPSFQSMVQLSLSNCGKCTTLPSLGQLSSLKVLHISCMRGVKKVNEEFYGDRSTCKPFPSLESLTFEDMLNWTFWFPFSNSDDADVETLFPCLAELKILQCPSLRFQINRPCLPSFVKLDVQECPHIKLQVGFPFLRELNVARMRGWGQGIPIDFNSLTALTKLRICDIPELTRVGELHSLTSLKELIIEKCPDLVSLPETGLPPMLSVLVLDGCERMKKLADGRGNRSLPFLERLELRNCEALKGFLDELPCKLKQLEIEGCINLKALPDGIMQATSSSRRRSMNSHLQVLTIKGCPSLKTIPQAYFSSSLKQLEIWKCDLSDKLLRNCAALEYLHMSNYPNLTTLEGHLGSLADLIRLKIVGCPKLESFPASGLPNNGRLQDLCIEDCENLKSLPQMQNLKSLRNLCVRKCPRLVSLPEGGLAPDLTSFGIEDCQNLKTHLSDWGLHKLWSLKAFCISGACPDVVSCKGSHHQNLLPRSLTRLSISKLHNLNSLAFLDLPNLRFLEELLISDCPKLLSFLPKDGLPPTLSRLEIKKCPGLIKRRLKEKGEDWDKIAHIPCIQIE